MSHELSGMGLNGYRILGYDNNQKVVVRARQRRRKTDRHVLFRGANRGLAVDRSTLKVPICLPDGL
jgi:hypothetical protein